MKIHEELKKVTDEVWVLEMNLLGSIQERQRARLTVEQGAFHALDNVRSALRELRIAQMKLKDFT